jgi:hypothetical protein
MDEDTITTTISIILPRLNSLDKILRVVTTEPAGGITSAGSAMTKSRVIGELATIPRKEDDKSASPVDDFQKEVVRRSESRALSRTKGCSQIRFKSVYAILFMTRTAIVFRRFKTLDQIFCLI